MSLGDSDVANTFLSGLQASFELNKQKSVEKKKAEIERVKTKKMQELDMIGKRMTKEKIELVNAQVKKEIP